MNITLKSPMKAIKTINKGIVKSIPNSKGSLSKKVIIKIARNIKKKLEQTISGK